MERNFKSDFAPKLLLALTAAGTTNVDTAVIDMGAGQGATELTGVFYLPTIVDGANVEVEVYSASAADKTGATLEGTTGVIAVTSADNGKLLTVSFDRVSQRYAYFKFKRTTQNSTVGSGIGLVGKLNREPADNSGLIGGKAFLVLGV
jgi:hypothetical protein